MAPNCLASSEGRSCLTFSISVVVKISSRCRHPVLSALGYIVTRAVSLVKKADLARQRIDRYSSVSHVDALQLIDRFELLIQWAFITIASLTMPTLAIEQAPVLNTIASGRTCDQSDIREPLLLAQSGLSCNKLARTPLRVATSACMAPMTQGTQPFSTLWVSPHFSPPASSTDMNVNGTSTALSR
jgi:hypothetical protein